MRRSAPAVIDSVRRRGLRYRATINGRNPGGYPTDARQNQNGCDGWAQIDCLLGIPAGSSVGTQTHGARIVVVSD